MKEVANLSRRYIVQTGEPRYVEIYNLNTNVTDREETFPEWTFRRAFKTIEDATAYADREAEDFEYVRVVDRRPDTE